MSRYFNSKFTRKPNNVLTTKTKVIFTVNDFVFTPDSVFKSEDFKIGSNKWQIIIRQINTLAKPTEPMFALCLTLKSEFIYVSVRFDSFIYDSNMNKKYYIKNYSTKALTHVYKDELTAINQMMTIKEFMAQKDILVPNKRLIIGLNIIVESNDVYECIQRSISYRKTFNVKEFNDLHIICGNKEFFVSKNILISHSEVFERMFSNEMREQNNNQLIIEDIDGEVFEEFLKFIYFGNSDKLEELKEDLLIIADKYHVLNLKSICQNLIYIEICDLNAIKILLTFDKYNSNYMVSKSIDFISKNLWLIRAKTPIQWKELIEGHYQLHDKITGKMSLLIENGLIGNKILNEGLKSYTFTYIS